MRWKAQGGEVRKQREQVARILKAIVRVLEFTLKQELLVVVGGGRGAASKLRSDMI